MPNNGLYEITPAGKLRYYYHKGQFAAWGAEERIVAILAGSQGGKTSFGPPWMLREIQRRGPGDYLVVTPTYPLLSKKLLPEFKRLFEVYLQLGSYRGSPDRQFTLSTEGQRRLFGASGPEYETTVFFGHAADPDSLESATAKAAWLDEAGQKKFKLASYEAIRRRLALHQGRILITTTPYNLGWLKQKIWDRRQEADIRVVRFTSLQNPVFPREEYDWAKDNLPRWRFDLYYRAIFTKPAGLIYDCFDDERQKVPRFAIPEDWSRYIGLDFGGVNTVALKYAEHPTSGNFYLYEAYKAGGKTGEEHARALLMGEPGIPFAVGGSKSEGNWRLEFRAGGLPVREPDITDVEVGITRVYGMHKNRRILVFDDLEEYLDEIGSYSRELDENGDPTEAIEDKADYHYMDAERYIMGWVNRKGYKMQAARVDWRAKGQAEPEAQPGRSQADIERELANYERYNL